MEVEEAILILSPYSTSYVGLPYLVCRFEGHQAVRPSKVRTASHAARHHRCRLDLLLHPFYGLDLLYKQIQRSIRDVRHGQPSHLARE